MKTSIFLGAALMLGVAAPTMAQVPPPPAGSVPDSSAGVRGPHGRMFGSMSEAGRTTMMDAMRGADPRGDHAATKAARDRMLTILDADRLDVGALKQAMDAEREAANAARIKHQSAMLVGFQKLSLADRKAFVADARAMRARMESRMGQGGPRGRKGAPPPPPMN